MPKFLLIRFSSIGDIVLTTPVIRCLKQQVENSEIHFLTKEAFAPVIEHNPFIDKKIYLADKLPSLIPELQKENYDRIVDLHHNLRTFQLKAALRKPSYSFNKINIAKWLMVNLKINKLPKLHIVDRYMEAVKQFGVVNDGKGLEYFISVKDGEAIQKLPGEFLNRYVVFVIGAKHFTKQLPKEKIVSICQKIKQPTILLGGKEDFEKGEEIVSRLNQELGTQTFFNACGKFSLNESAAIIKHADWVITHDTGLMHIAAAFKKKIVSVWGNTVPQFGMEPYYGNFEVENLISEVQGLSCRPCTKIGFTKCPMGHFKCMMDIDEKEMIAFIK